MKQNILHLIGYLNRYFLIVEYTDYLTNKLSSDKSDSPFGGKLKLEKGRLNLVFYARYNFPIHEVHQIIQGELKRSHLVKNKSSKYDIISLNKL